MNWNKPYLTKVALVLDILVVLLVILALCDGGSLGLHGSFSELLEKRRSNNS